MKFRNVLLVMLIGLTLSGCALLQHGMCAPDCKSEARNSSSLVNFLYPDGAIPPPEDSVPELRVPLRVGLSFLPQQTSYGSTGLDAAHKDALLQQVRQRFADRKFVSEIVVIPDYYLASKRGFEGLAGAQRLYNVDVMALVSYDQVTHLDDNKLSLGYLTIVGAYVLKGSEHDTTTLVDLAVVDPATRSLVLRAGGTDSRGGSSTLVDQSSESRQASAKSFDAATTQMIGNFDVALTKFEADVKAGKASVRVVNRNAPSSGGAGSMSYGLIFVLLVGLAARKGRRREIARSAITRPGSLQRSRG